MGTMQTEENMIGPGEAAQYNNNQRG